MSKLLGSLLLNTRGTQVISLRHSAASSKSKVGDVRQSRYGKSAHPNPRVQNHDSASTSFCIGSLNPMQPSVAWQSRHLTLFLCRIHSTRWFGNIAKPTPGPFGSSLRGSWLSEVLFDMSELSECVCVRISFRCAWLLAGRGALMPASNLISLYLVVDGQRSCWQAGRTRVGSKAGKWGGGRSQGLVHWYRSVVPSGGCISWLAVG